MTPRRLFTNTDAGKRMSSTSVAVGVASAISTESSTSHDSLSSRDEISFLRRRLLELNERNEYLQKTVLLLSKQIAVLTKKHEQQQVALDQEEIMTTPVDHEGKDEQDKDLNEAADISMRCRVFSENAEFLLKLSSLIEDFTTRAELSDRRKFPECCLAKIIVDSVSAFDWTHSELSRFAIQQQRRTSTGRPTTADGSSTTAQLTSELLAVMNRKRQGRHRGDKSKATLLVQCLWDDGFLHGEAKACMINKVRQYLRRHVFPHGKY